MKKIFKSIIAIVSMVSIVAVFASCEDVFEPAIENQRDIDAILLEPSYAQGLIGAAYASLPYSYQGSVTTDLATDDAVCNDQTNNYTRMATGSWASDNNPVNQWQDRYAAIQYANLVLENVDQVRWAAEEPLRIMYADHFRGEAYGMRALQMYYLLRAHSGVTDDGVLRGVPIHTHSEDATSDFNVERPEFAECVKQVIADLDSALNLLRYENGNTTTENIPEKYRRIGATIDQYNRAFGDHLIGRINGKVCEALKSEMLLLAASPAFGASGYIWEQAAQAAAVCLKHIGGIDGMDPNGGTYYCNYTEMDNLSSNADPKEILWRGDMQQHTTLEGENYPPTLEGNGRVNPTQNFVDAFPMVNGYPITVSGKGYDPANPYANRDPRLAKYVVYNGCKLGVNDDVINTQADSPDNNGLNKVNQRSTRTGYYLRKLLRSDVNLVTGTNKNHYVARIRYTEIFLNYAEACNEAYGPTGSQGGCGSAYDVIKKIRQRAGIVGDDYLEECKGDQAKMRELIRNERRIELCFEGFRFWDLRRWNATLNTAAKGMSITTSGTTLNYNPIDVENRQYSDYMIYGPIPYSEILKFSALKQNAGWK